jgi:aspartyl-tRNA(Asn)/glutamyl-tRNA(Gln) amidotransferase subunit A
MDLTKKTLAELSKLFQSGKASSREITEAFIANIEAREKDINAFVTTTFDLAREMADAADSRFKNKTLLSPIDGMPIALKDVVCTKEAKTTASSNVLKDFQSPYDAEVWKRLKEAGAVLLGKTNTDEFTMGASTETSAFGVTKNPYDLERVAGGSSGGSTAAVAANFCTAAIGTDTGGSIRQPAHFCGVTGLKVSYGRVSRWGTIPMASSLDTVGPIAKTAEDCAMILQVIAGQDEKDSTTLKTEVLNYTELLDTSIEGLKIGLPEEYFETEGVESDVLEVIESTKAILTDLGAKLVPISLPHTEYGVPVYYIIAPSEISANMARFDGIRFGSGKEGKTLDDIYKKTREEGFGDELKRRILLGTYALSAGYYDAFYRKAQKVRTLIKEDFDKAFEEVDAILTPVSPTSAFKIGANSTPLQMYLEDTFTIPASLAGVCGMSIPVGKSEEGELPIGAQLIGPQSREDRILRIAHQIQRTVNSE